MVRRSGQKKNYFGAREKGAKGVGYRNVIPQLQLAKNKGFF
jgi:hypothetical protein